MILAGISWSGYSQNTKGDRPVKNQRQVRETKVKSYKRKEKGRTRDVAGRRLRTKDQSSANRANAKYPQPSPYSRRQRSQPETAAKPRGRVFSKSPRESRRRDWHGDVSGYKLNRIKPTGADAARNNVYPQKGPYVRYARKKPKEKPPVYGKTIKGTKFVKHTPRHEERAWKGGRDGGPIKNQSATAQHKNTFSQSGPYVRYYNKRMDRKPKPVSNQHELSRVKRLSRTPRTGGSQPTLYPASASEPFIQRGKKNVYWGKVQRKERATTKDLTGAPVRTRNYRSVPAGLVGRDTLKFYGKKPLGDRGGRAPSGGFRTATRKGQRGWKGDISGYNLRHSRSRGAGVQPSLTPTPPGLGGTWLSKTFNRKFKGVKPDKKGGGSIRRGAWNNGGQAVQVRTGGVGAARAARFQGNMRSYGKEKTFSDQGTGFSGNMKSYGKGKTFGDQGVGYSGNLRRNRLARQNKQGAGYAGNIRSYGKGKTFNDQGIGYSGNVRRGRPARLNEQGTRFSGHIKREGADKTFDDAGLGYSGNLKRWRLNAYTRQGFGYPGDIKRRGAAKTFSDEGLGYSGNMKRYGAAKNFGDQGVGYSGNLRRRGRGPGEGTVNASKYRGTYKRWQIAPFFSDQGAEFSGNQKARKPEKGGGSRSGILWNNQNQAIQVRTPLGRDARAANYSGHIKFKRPEKGGGSRSGELWNNSNQAIQVRTPLGRDAKAANYSGHIKYKRPEKGGGSRSGILWNNNNEAIAVRTPGGDAKAAEYSGKIKLARFKKTYVQNPNADKESLKKHRPDPTTYRVAGLQVKVREKDYARKPHGAKDALPGIAPSKSTVKASEYARSMKQYWDYKRNPNSHKEALKVREPSKANARIGDYQGNVKMHKYGGGRMHPDAQFAHGYRDNVKEERTFMMNVKLAWAKLFRKSENQPENLKEKVTKPRYDKREKGLWND